MTWYAIDTWIVIVGILCAVACALPGCFLLLRHMSMMGDAISHAVLPGLAVGFLLTGSRASLAMFVSAALVGVFTAVFTQWISHWGKVDRGASMGIVFTTLFAIGLLLIVRAADHVDLDPGCVLYGAIELTPLESVNLSLPGIPDASIPRAALTLGGVLLLNLTLILLFFKEFRISSFDPELATALGISASFMHYLLMVMVAVTTVASFEAVGSIIVIAMLIVPAASAFLLTRHLTTMLALSALFAALSAALGHLAALAIPPLLGFGGTSTSGMMATVAGILLLAVILFAPGEGLVGRNRRRQRIEPPISPLAALNED